MIIILPIWWYLYIEYTSQFTRNNYRFIIVIRKCYYNRILILLLYYYYSLTLLFSNMLPNTYSLVRRLLISKSYNLYNIRDHFVVFWHFPYSFISRWYFNILNQYGLFFHNPYKYRFSIKCANLKYSIFNYI